MHALNGYKPFSQVLQMQTKSTADSQVYFNMQFLKYVSGREILKVLNEICYFTNEYILI